MNIAICYPTKVEIVFTSAALRQWLRLSGEVRARLNAKLLTYAQTGQGDVKRLKGQPGARLRVGDWRIVFYVERNTLFVVAVGHRREIYD
jgi:mRNA interferase RelE/StbE